MDTNKKGIAKQLLDGEKVYCKNCNCGIYASANNVSVNQETIFKCTECGDMVILAKKIIGIFR